MNRSRAAADGTRALDPVGWFIGSAHVDVALGMLQHAAPGLEAE